MIASAEVRWFCQAQGGGGLEDWFEQLPGPSVEEAPRTDTYLRPTDPALNIKVREGHVEVKRRQEVMPLGEGLAGLEGWRECWRKWRFTCEEEEPSGGAALWVEVTKQRRKRCFVRTREGQVVAVRQPEQQQQGCDLELTHVQAAGQHWVTLGLEAFGREAALLQTLDAVLEHVVRLAAPPPLRRIHSMGYAAWLLELERTNG